MLGEGADRPAPRTVGLRARPPKVAGARGTRCRTETNGARDPASTSRAPWSQSTAPPGVRSQASLRAPAGGDGGTGRATEAVDVLVVDDDEGVRQTVAEILRRAQHTVAEAGDGEQALHRLEELVVRALVVDVRMPRLDGLALLQMLDHPPPAIVISAYFVEEDVRRSLGAKVCAYLRKPFRPEHLLQAVTAALGGGSPA